MSKKNDSLKTRILRTLQHNPGQEYSTYDLAIGTAGAHVVRGRVSELKQEGHPIQSRMGHDGVSQVAFHKFPTSEELPL